MDFCGVFEASGPSSQESFDCDHGVDLHRTDDMKTLFRSLSSLIFLVVLLLAGAMRYSTAKGYTTWYFRVSGQVTVDGHNTSGYMHANTERTLLLLTRTDETKPETYLISLVDRKLIFDCGKWHPIRFFPMPIGDLNPPCSFFTVDPVQVVDAPVSATLVLGRKSIEFSTASGKKVKAEW